MSRGKRKGCKTVWCEITAVRSHRKLLRSLCVQTQSVCSEIGSVPLPRCTLTPNCLPVHPDNNHRCWWFTHSGVIRLPYTCWRVIAPSALSPILSEATERAGSCHSWTRGMQVTPPLTPFPLKWDKIWPWCKNIFYMNFCVFLRTTFPSEMVRGFDMQVFPRTDE